MAKKFTDEEIEKLRDQAADEIEDAVDTVLFEAFGNKLYSEIEGEDKDEWDRLFDILMPDLED